MSNSQNRGSKRLDQEETHTVKYNKFWHRSQSTTATVPLLGS